MFEVNRDKVRIVQHYLAEAATELDHARMALIRAIEANDFSATDVESRCDEAAGCILSATTEWKRLQEAAMPKGGAA